MTSWRCWLHKRVSLLFLLLATAAAADVDRRTLHDGNLVLEDVPAIPDEIIDSLNRYQNVRAARFRAWTDDGTGIYVSTGFGDVDSIHRVDMPGGARRQITFYNEPVGDVQRQPQSGTLLFTRDVGGSEFAQIFRLDLESGDATMLTDGTSRNSAVVWDRQGTRIAYRSTRRNGASNDVWIMDPEKPEEAEIALEANDGSWWAAAEFSESGSRLLLWNYHSVTDSRIHVLDLDTGEATWVAGGDEAPSANVPVAFDENEDGVWLVTDRGGEFNQLAWQGAVPESTPVIVTKDIPWSVNSAVVSHDRRRLAFVTNENGMSRVYLLDPATRQYRRVDNIPTGVAFGLRFSPDDRHLGMTLNTPQSPSDAFTLELGEGPRDYGTLTRWTKSEMGGLDRSELRAPELVHYPTFDEVDGGRRQIPAWVYRPVGPGPCEACGCGLRLATASSRPARAGRLPVAPHDRGSARVRPASLDHRGRPPAELDQRHGAGQQRVSLARDVRWTRAVRRRAIHRV